VVAKGFIRVAAVSIVATLLIVVGLLQATGLISLFPFGQEWTVQWLVFVLLGVVLVAVGIWSWRSEPD